MTKPQPLAPCGTLSAYRRHLRWHEPACQSCLDAGARFAREYSARRLTRPARRRRNDGIDLRRAKESPEQRFWRYVNKSDGCWEYTGHIKTSSGYGEFYWVKPDGQKSGSAHRFSYWLHYQTLPDDLLVCHHCDNRRCVRPDHLFLGTAFDNMQDASRKGRIRNGWTVQRGAAA